MPQVLRIYADGLSDYEDCTSLSWRCRMTFVNSTQSVINPGDWVPQDNCILCRPLPTSGVGMLQVVVELLALDGKRSAGAINTYLGFAEPEAVSDAAEVVLPGKGKPA